MKQKTKILVILGATSSGKSDLAVELALKHNGEVVSADSRQVYKGLDVGTGKITAREMKGIKHHLLSVASPRRAFTVSQFKKKADNAIADIASRGKLPILAGGTGFYIQAIVDNFVLPEVAPNLKLRTQLEKKNTEEIFSILKKLDPRRAKEIDKNNPRRLIRAIEIATTLGSVPHLDLGGPSGGIDDYDILQIGIRVDEGKLKEKISQRNEKMIDNGLLDEVKSLLKQKITKKRIRELGFEYSIPLDFIEDKITKTEMLEKMNSATWQYVKRQNTWFKRDGRIEWFDAEDDSEIKNTVTDFLKTV